MKVFLCGECNTSEWRESIIPMLDVDFVDPSVDDMREKYKEPDIYLYVITPASNNFHCIAEAINDSNKRPNQTILLLLRKDDDFQFAPLEWEALEGVARIVIENESEVFYSLKDAADDINAMMLEKLEELFSVN